MGKSMKSGQEKLTQTGQLFLLTGMLTMLLLMTTNTMTPLMEESNMKVLSHTGGLHNILRYETTNRKLHPRFRRVEPLTRNWSRGSMTSLLMMTMLP